jgi:uncharacterized membrane protein YedE/YeeE
MHGFTPISALIGGALIGLAASLLLLVHGRIAGIAGIFGETLRGDGVRGEGAFRVAFLIGLALAALAFRFVHPSSFGSTPTHWAGVMLAGVLVGYGTRLGGGCTSGHGVCGMSRLSIRSIVATCTFLLTAFGTVYVTHHVLGGP